MSTTSGKEQKTVNRIQEKTLHLVKVVKVKMVIFIFGFGHFVHYI